MAKRFHPYQYDRRRRSRPSIFWLLVALIMISLTTVLLLRPWDQRTTELASSLNLPPDHGRVIGIDAVQTYTAAQAQALSRQNYGATAPTISSPITKITFHYRSRDADGTALTIYGRAYIPMTTVQSFPVFAFAPGTTGIGDQCAASLEQPAKINWGNYDSHMVTYASQGYIAVTTDYEGMRDPRRLHHYMVGELEGRALLDSVLALGGLPETRGRVNYHSVFLAGYSQGGHAAYWGDKIALDYAPALSIKGVVGYGPVMSVTDTVGNVVYGANINWFGSYVIASYQDYYHRTYPLDKILQPNWIPNLQKDVVAHCIDTDIAHWGHDAAKVYTSEFLNAFKAGTLDSYVPVFALDMQRNFTGDQTTASAKRINEGKFDNVVLPREQEAVVPIMCQRSQGSVQYVVYPTATHYDTMVKSFKDTINWMQTIQTGQMPATTCGT